MKNYRYLGFVFALLWIGIAPACSDDEDGGSASQTVETETLEAGDASLSIEAETAVIEDATIYAAFLSDIGSTLDPTAVDFSTHTVLAAVMGPQDSGGHSIEITEVSVVVGITETIIVAKVVNTVPGADCLVTQAVTNPYHIVSISKSEYEVTFEQTTVVEDC